MPSGKPLTEQQVDRILKLAGLIDLDGEYALSYAEIAENLSLHRHTVERAVRRAAVKWGEYDRWKDTPL